MLDIDRRAYLDAEPLLIIAEQTMSARADADRPAMAMIRSNIAPTRWSSTRLLRFPRRRCDGINHGDAND